MLSLLLGLSFGGCMTVKPVSEKKVTLMVNKSADVLLIDAFLLSAEYGNIYVNSQGHVFMTSDPATGEMQQIATLTADGKMTSKDGRVVASITESGVITGMNNQPLNATISDTRVLKMGDKTISIGDDGSIAGANQEAPKIHVVGVDVNQHKTVLFLLASIMGQGMEMSTSGGPTAAERSLNSEDTTKKKLGRLPDVSENAEQKIAMGSLDKSLIKKVIDQNKNKIIYCYEKELQKNPNLGGKLNIKFTIATDGSVSHVKVDKSTLASPVVGQCIAKRFKDFKFAKPTGNGIVVVRYPFVFSPE